MREDSAQMQEDLAKVILDPPQVLPSFWGWLGRVLGEVLKGSGTLGVGCLADDFEHSVELSACMWLEHSKYRVQLTRLSF